MVKRLHRDLGRLGEVQVGERKVVVRKAPCRRIYLSGAKCNHFGQETCDCSRKSVLGNRDKLRE